MSANNNAAKRILVTGGSGLVGKGIQSHLEHAGKDSQEEWIFLRSAEADLR